MITHKETERDRERQRERETERERDREREREREKALLSFRERAMSSRLKVSVFITLLKHSH